MNHKSLFAILAVALLVALPLSFANAQQIQQGYSPRATVTGTVGQAVNTGAIFMNGATAFAFVITATGGTFNSTTLAVQVSLDGTTFVTVDTISLSTGTANGKFYDDDNKASTVAVNPANFPYLKLVTSAGVGSVTEKIYYSAR